MRNTLKTEVVLLLVSGMFNLCLAGPKCPDGTALLKNKTKNFSVYYCVETIATCPDSIELEYFEIGKGKGCYLAHGPALYQYKTGATALVNFSKGRLHGKYQTWLPNKKKGTVESYHMGKRHGNRETWHQNGKPATKESYSNGLRHGEFYTWYANGKMKSHVDYLQGKRNGVQYKWYENGARKQEAHYQRDMWHGLYKEWYSNGNLFSVRSYNWGFPEGTWLYAYKNGKKKSLLYYQKGRINGQVTEWAVDGQREAQYDFEKGKLKKINFLSKGDRDYVMDSITHPTTDCSKVHSLYARYLASVVDDTSCVGADFDGNHHLDYAFKGKVLLMKRGEVMKTIDLRETQFELYQPTMNLGLFEEPVTPRPGIVRWGTGKTPTKVFLYDYDKDTFVASYHASEDR